MVASIQKGRKTQFVHFLRMGVNTRLSKCCARFDTRLSVRRTFHFGSLELLLPFFLSQFLMILHVLVLQCTTDGAIFSTNLFEKNFERVQHKNQHKNFRDFRHKFPEPRNQWFLIGSGKKFVGLGSVLRDQGTKEPLVPPVGSDFKHWYMIYRLYIFNRSMSLAS